jgi:hypothetical protein
MTLQNTVKYVPPPMLYGCNQKHSQQQSQKYITAYSKASRNGHRWTESEIEQLIHEAQDIKTLNEIAEIHKRAISSIRFKLLQYVEKLVEEGIHIDSIIKILPLKKKEIIDYLEKRKEEKDNKKMDDEIGLIEYPPKYIPYEQRNVILFDLNGTLCYRTKGFPKEINIRPYIRELSKLKNYYRIGVYTSMMRSNALDIIRLIEQQTGRIFDRSMIFTREHTISFDEDEYIIYNIPQYKTKKSIALVLPEIYNEYNDEGSKISIKVIDDEIVKIVEKEDAIIVPTWSGEKDDNYIKTLVSELIPM